ncbi:MAG: FAE1/Type III polyketide synthase-like protein-domain-containing protein [Monoraphidium minutum]|nr:MAG: FAE1/Type III polyketide synthase-like protein-domain-containing protein [Monoraphidium minutum]
MAPRPVYLVDFSVYKPPEELKVNYLESQKASRQWKECKEENFEFISRIFQRSGISAENTYLPPWINPVHSKVPKYDMDTAKKEAEMVMCGAVADLLEKTGTRPQDIDVLITNCSIYCPTPSLASMLVNHFKFRQDVQSYHLGGMGCGNGVMALSLLRDLLQARPNCRALFVPAEITTYCFYPGLQKDFMVANAIFRMGGAAVLLSNQPRFARSAKYELVHNVRVHTGADDGSYTCMGWGPDKEGVNGVFLRKDVPLQAAKALEICLRTIAPKILTWGQYAEAALNLFEKAVLGRSVPEYVPDFTKCVDHFALHAGGYAVLKGLQQAMRLPAAKMLPSFGTLRDYGNTSCSTTWYVMAYMETCEDVRRGQTIMQIGMGGGMKAGVNIWRAMRDIRTIHPAWRHVAHRPITEADLPRPITDPNSRLAAVPAGDVAAAVKASFGADMRHAAAALAAPKDAVPAPAAAVAAH